eukprot:scaffold1190_cov393-Prasinococcus_capsulatus_cf.AAC.48
MVCISTAWQDRTAGEWAASGLVLVLWLVEYGYQNLHRNVTPLLLPAIPVCFVEDWSGLGRGLLCPVAFQCVMVKS